MSDKNARICRQKHPLANFQCSDDSFLVSEISSLKTRNLAFCLGKLRLEAGDVFIVVFHLSKLIIYFQYAVINFVFKKKILNNFVS